MIYIKITHCLVYGYLLFKTQS